MSFDLSPMDYAAEFLRGWPTAPDSGSRETNRFSMASGVECEIGDLVVLDASSNVVAPGAQVASGVFIVVRGTLDDKSVNGCRKPILLPGNYQVRTIKTTGPLAVGDEVSAAPVTVGGRTYGVFKKVANPGDPFIGVVLQVIVGSAETSYVIDVK